MDYLYDAGNLKIDCDIGCNMYGDGRLFVEYGGRRVFEISNSYPHNMRKDLPKAIASCISHNVLVYDSGEWEQKIEELVSGF